MLGSFTAGQSLETVDEQGEMRQRPAKARVGRSGSRAVVLTGFMGTGKTAVGKRVARRLGYRFLDTDEMIVARERRSIARIFATDGEAYFRSREREVVAEAAAETNVVIATGGGTIVDEENFRVLQAAGPMICLTASPDVILKRTRGKSRPLLPMSDRLARIRALLSERAPAYARVPSTVDTSSCTIGEAVTRVLEIVAAATRTGAAKH
jgi:shikimate kinase